MRRTIIATLIFILLISSVYVGSPILTTATSKFEFNGSMSKEVLRSYVSRAVTFQGFAVENNDENLIFEEDLRMIRNIGAKYIGRAAFYSWGGDMTTAQIESHFEVAKKQAAKAHASDPELILQAGVFEIAYQGTVNNTLVPAYVFEAFGQPVVKRNFDYRKIVFPEGTKDVSGTDTGIGCWGNISSGVPDITQLETKMYFYYQITRYIDAGYEAFHMGQAEKMMLYRGNSYAHHWDELLTKARNYAKTHARRGIALFDCHTALGSGGIKVGNRLIFDIQGAAAVPNETGMENGAMTCELTLRNKCWLSWIGTSAGGEHPLGFNIDTNFTIIEFDNYGGNGKAGEPTEYAFYNWGMDDITWFATQPEWYRNRFLLESADFLKRYYLDKNGNQQYFLQPALRRIITPESKYSPKIEYVPEDNFNQDFLLDYVQKEKSNLKYNSSKNKYTLTVNGFYRANNCSDACPNGFSQEDTIRKIFLGENANDENKYTNITIPQEYKGNSTNTQKEITEITSSQNAEDSSVKSSTTSETTSTKTTKVSKGKKEDNKEEKQSNTKNSNKQKSKQNNYIILIVAGAVVLVIGLIALAVFLFAKIL